jgi:hypothetical protein
MFGTLKQVTVKFYVLSTEGIKKYCFLYIVPHLKQRCKSLNGMQAYQIVHVKLSCKSVHLKKKGMKVFNAPFLIDSWL